MNLLPTKQPNTMRRLRSTAMNSSVRNLERMEQGMATLRIPPDDESLPDGSPGYRIPCQHEMSEQKDHQSIFDLFEDAEAESIARADADDAKGWRHKQAPCPRCKRLPVECDCPEDACEEEETEEEDECSTCGNLESLCECVVDED